MVELTTSTNSKGASRVTEKVSPGERVNVTIDVSNPPHYDWGVPKNIRGSYPLTTFVTVPRNGNSRRGFKDSPFDYDSTKLDINEDGNVVVEFDMPECLDLVLKFQVILSGGNVIYSTATARSGTLSYTREKPQTITLKVVARSATDGGE